MESITDLHLTNKFSACSTGTKKTTLLAKDKDSKKFLDYKIADLLPSSTEIACPFPYTPMTPFVVSEITRSKFEANKKTCTQDTVPFYSRSFYSFENLEYSPVSQNFLEFPSGMDTRN